MRKYLVSLLLVISGFNLLAQTKEVQYLSGKDNDHTVAWDFWCTGGRKAGVWTKINVPGHWEQQGFGEYNYGRDYVTYGKNFRFALFAEVAFPIFVDVLGLCIDQKKQKPIYRVDQLMWG